MFHKIITSGMPRLQPLYDCLLTIMVNSESIVQSVVMFCCYKTQWCHRLFGLWHHWVQLLCCIWSYKTQWCCAIGCLVYGTAGYNCSVASGPTKPSGAVPWAVWPMAPLGTTALLHLVLQNPVVLCHRLFGLWHHWVQLLCCIWSYKTQWCCAMGCLAYDTTGYNCSVASGPTKPSGAVPWAVWPMAPLGTTALLHLVLQNPVVLCHGLFGLWHHWVQLLCCIWSYKTQWCCAIGCLAYDTTGYNCSVASGPTKTSGAVPWAVWPMAPLGTTALLHLVLQNPVVLCHGLFGLWHHWVQLLCCIWSYKTQWCCAMGCLAYGTTGYNCSVASGPTKPSGAVP